MVKKKIFLVLSLFAINILLAWFFLSSTDIEASPSGCVNTDKIYNKGDITITEGVRCDDYRDESFGIGREMFKYYGLAADCYSYDSQAKIDRCLSEYPFGRAGTMKTGGNWVVSKANNIMFNGFDGAGMHWWMTTTTEPLGNAFGLYNKNYDRSLNSFNYDSAVKFGNDVVPQKDVLIMDKDPDKKLTFRGDNNIVNFTLTDDLDGDGVPDTDTFYYSAPNGINIDGLLKTVNNYEEGSIWYVQNKPAGYKKQYVWDYYLKENNDPDEKDNCQNKEQYIGHCCCGFGGLPPFDGNCYPQPYTHFRVINYKAESEYPSDTEEKATEGGICTVACGETTDGGQGSVYQSDKAREIRDNNESPERDCNNNNDACVEGCEEDIDDDPDTINLGVGSCDLDAPEDAPCNEETSDPCNGNGSGEDGSGDGGDDDGDDGDCSDSDGGTNLYDQGCATDETGTFCDYCSNGEIFEYFCNSGEAQYDHDVCPTGYMCEDGACVDDGSDDSGDDDVVCTPGETRETEDIICDDEGEVPQNETEICSNDGKYWSTLSASCDCESGYYDDGSSCSPCPSDECSVGETGDCFPPIPGYWYEEQCEIVDAPDECGDYQYKGWVWNEVDSCP